MFQKSSVLACSILLVFHLFIPKNCHAQTRPTKAPRLAVGIVVDQMRYDFLLKYYEKYGSGGFKRLLEGGFNCENTHYNYAPTVTGPGHASIFAGTTPAVHGIVGNEWFSRATGKMIYCASDADATNVGGSTDAGKMSPRRLRSANISDELRLFSNKKSKVVGIALKDRGSILPAGHCPNAAYWFDAKTASWMTSNWYMNELPSWVVDFNKLDLPSKYVAGGWSPLPETLLPGRSIADDNNYEILMKGEKSPVFPHNLAEIAVKEGTGRTLMNSPFGNNLTEEFAKTAILNEKLGADEFPDLLALSFSCTDIIGHGFGPTSLEIEDTYLRLDRTLADFFTFLDEKVGKGEWVIFLSADHGAAYNSNFLKDNKITTAGFFGASRAPADSLAKSLFLLDTLNDHLFKIFGKKKLIAGESNSNIYFNKAKIAADSLDFGQVEQVSIDFLEKLGSVLHVLTAKQLKENEYTKMPKSLIQEGFLQGESGDLVVIFGPGMLDFGEKGTSHGTPWSYDTRVPCIFYGWQVQKGTYSGAVNITDIAPTLSIMLNIPFPAGCTGEPIAPVLKMLQEK
jgi:predicted AlkP superfamily pyrophosphatase or phosphodiesterase